MYSVSVFLFILAVWIDGFSLEDVHCNYIFKQKCQGDVNNYNIVGYNSSIINYCTAEDVPDEINFTVWSDNGKGEFSDSLKIEFAPPKRKCIYGIALLVNPSIEDERECREYKFEEAEDINSTIHTIERTLCIHTNTNQFVRYNDNSTVPLCKDNIGLWFHYIFTGCYALRFHLDKQTYLIKGHNFLNTTYQRTEVVEPQFICKYNTYSDLDQRNGLTNFTLDILLPADTGSSLEMAIINHGKDEKSCIWRGQKLIHIGTVYLRKDDRNCSVKLTQTIHGEYMRNVVCNFQVRVPQNEGYCFIFRVIDNRCHKNTLWKPPSNEMFSCTWIKRCLETSDNSLHVENANEIKSDKLLTTSSYLLLPIITIVLIVSAIIGTLCVLHYLRIRKEEVNLYVNPQPDDFLNSACLKSDFGIVENNDKEIDHDNFKCDDIVLLYTKNSTSFMALMKDFRETLAKICSCSVHDWHDGAEWNDVAKVGAVLWFTELLNNGCRVIWVDTPATRSIVTSNSKESALNKFSKYYEIGDFRDVAFPVVLELAKRNTKNTVFQYRRHFVVRFEGLESTANGDPFLDLSPHARYRMPQHLAQLCSDLVVVKTAVSLYQMKAEEDFLQQRLMKMESLM